MFFLFPFPNSCFPSCHSGNFPESQSFFPSKCFGWRLQKVNKTVLRHPTTDLKGRTRISLQPRNIPPVYLNLACWLGNPWFRILGNCINRRMFVLWGCNQKFTIWEDKCLDFLGKTSQLAFADFPKRNSASFKTCRLRVGRQKFPLFSSLALSVKASHCCDHVEVTDVFNALLSLPNEI